MDRETEEKILDAMFMVSNDYRTLALSPRLVGSLRQRFEESLMMNDRPLLRYFGRRLRWMDGPTFNFNGTNYLDPQVNELWQLYLAGFTNGAAALMLAPTPRDDRW